MELDMKFLIVFLCIILCEALGFFVGFCIKNSMDFKRQKSFKFVSSKFGLFRLNTASGQLDLIKTDNTINIIHRGKHFYSYPGSFDFVENANNDFILFNTFSGSYTIINDRLCSVSFWS